MIKVALLLGIFVSGCSYTFQSRPSSGPAVANKQCSTTHAYWIADAVGVAAGIAAMTYAVIQRDENHANIVGGAGAMGGLFYTGSMVSGLKWRGECERGPAIESLATR